MSLTEMGYIWQIPRKTILERTEITPELNEGAKRILAKFENHIPASEDWV